MAGHEVLTDKKRSTAAGSSFRLLSLYWHICMYFLRKIQMNGIILVQISEHLGCKLLGYTVHQQYPTL